VDGVSCLCVSNRPEFLAWVIWNFDKQQYHGDKELVIVGADLPVPRREGIRYIGSSGNIPRKRNIAQAHARYNTATWFDDDDWQHPDKLSLVAMNAKHGTIIGCLNSFFVTIDLVVNKYCGNRFLFNSVGFPSHAPPVFNESKDKGSDSAWVVELMEKNENHILSNELMFFWLAHERNISNPKVDIGGNSNIEAVKKAVGAKNWGETNKWLQLMKPVKLLKM
jgi:hypothetical protein